MAAAGSKPTDTTKAGGGAVNGSRPTRRRIFIVAFKWCRIAVLLVVFVAIVLGLFLNHVGLPAWVEAGLQRRIEEQGWDVKFSRLRLRWYHGVVAEDLQLRRTNTATGPNIFLRSAEFRPNWRALWGMRLESEGVALQDGRLIWPLPGTNQPQRTLLLDQLGGELLFRPGDTWELKFLESVCRGVHVRFRGEITNASLLRAWKLPAPAERAPAVPGDFWHRLLSDLEKVRFAGQPTANVIFYGDARDWRGFDVSVRLTAAGVASPWGGGTNVTAVARTLPPVGTNDPIRLSLEVNANDARTRWVDADNLDLALRIEPSLQHLLPTNAMLSAQLTGARADWGRAGRLSIDARCQPEGGQAEERTTRVSISGLRIETRWGNATRLEGNVAARHGATNYLPARLETFFMADQLQTRWLTSQWSRVEAQVALPPAGQISLLESNRLWIDRLTNMPFHLTATVSNALTGGYVIDRADTTVDWQAPEARVFADVVSGEAAVSAGVTANAETGRVAFTNAATLRPDSFARYLTTNAQRWLADFDSLQTPSIEGGGRFTLPVRGQWTTNWRAEVLPTLELRGRLDARSVSFRGVEFASAKIPFTLTNQVWGLADLSVRRPEGTLRLNARADETTGAFRIDVASGINPTALRPALPGASGVMGLFELTNLPPRIEAQLSGNWRDWSTLNGTANVLLTNLSFRGVPILGVTARLAYTNRWLAILDPVALREGERAGASGIGIDLAEPRLYLTNGVGRLSPLAVGQAIGPITRRTIEPYAFELPPDARVEGSVPLGTRNRGTDDMRFEIDGGRFHWNVLHFERLKGTVLWRGQHLILTNMAGLWHGGTMKGWAHFDFDAPRGGSMAFDAQIADSALKAIIMDFNHGRTNKLEGTISGRIRVTHADVNNLRSWNGRGSIQLREGLIWDMPIFGLLSPVLNSIIPGLGNSRAKEGRATFTMTNSVIHSEDLEIVANATRLRYDGEVDLDGNVSARVEAELMREIPAIGRLISTVFWPVTKLLKYSVSGTLEKPKMEPDNVFGGILTLPFMPFKALNEILTPEKKVPEPPAPEK